MPNPTTKDLKRSKYRLLGLVGQGQFGRVFCAIHRKTGKLVALKELDKARFPTHQFLRELRFLLSLRHPNLVGCDALEHTSTGRYLVMDYCEGGTLRGLMHEEMRIHPRYALQLVTDVLDGLEHAHTLGIVHCDIKPENILLNLRDQGWIARISDFGIARLSQELDHDFSNTGSPAYMAPERFYGQYSPASDLYAVGILLFELLIGDRPFSGLPKDLMAAHLNHPVMVPDRVPPLLKAIILKSLQKLPARRYRSAAEMKAQILKAIAQLSPPAAATIYLHSELSSSPVACHVVRQETLTQPLSQLVVQALPNLSSTSEPAWQIDRIAADRIDTQIGPTDPVTFAVPAEAEATANLGITLAAPIQAIAMTPQERVVVIQQSVYSLPSSLFQPSSLPQQVSFDQLKSYLIASFPPSTHIGIDRQARWLVGLATEAEPLGVNLWTLRLKVNPQPVHRTVYLPEQPQVQPFQVMALDARYGVICSHLLSCRDGTVIGTQLRGLTRRGTWIGTLEIPVPIRQILLHPSAYRLLATEPEFPTSLLMIDLKPLRMQRLEVGIIPAQVAASSWGYGVIAANGEMVLLNTYGDVIGRISGPPHPTAMTCIEPYGLLIATWYAGTGSLVTIDLRQLDLDIVF